MKTKMTTLIIALFLLSGISIQAQEEEKTKIVRPLQISFISPMGTNGLASWDVTNNFSLNIFAGYSHGVEGLEIGGFYNMLKGDMNGIQIAGFGNKNKGKTNGGQVSGFFNMNGDAVTGIQFAGFTNIVHKGGAEACQVAGFTNIVKGKVKGAQISGFANVNTDSLEGAQISGFSNVIRGSLKGVQIGGFSNYAEEITEGGQISGFANTNIGSTKGVQISGFANITKDDVEGAQISGFYNQAKKVKGSQIGIINIADSIEKGITVGVFSYVKHGYRKFEVSGNENLYGIVSFKTGTKRFYNILSIGFGVKDNDYVSGWGYGVGTLFPVHEKVNVNIDAVAYQLNEGTWRVKHLNMVNKLSITASYALNDYVTVFGGPTLNVSVTDLVDNEGKAVSSNLSTPAKFFDKTYKNTNVKMYPGFSIGVRL